MTEEDLRKNLKNFNLTIPKACIQIYERTGETVSSKNVNTHLERNGKLSSWQTVAFIFFFKILEGAKHEQTAAV